MNDTERYTGVYRRNLQPPEKPPELPNVVEMLDDWGSLAQTVLDAAQGDWPNDWSKVDREEALQRAREVQAGINTLYCAIGDGDLTRVAILAALLGRVYERLLVLRSEWLALAGRKSHDGSAEGGQKKRLSAEEKERRRRQWQHDVTELMAANPHMLYKTATRRLANKYDVSARTIQQYTSRPNNL